jgi:Protein of unknown function with PCYCGC motif
MPRAWFVASAAAVLAAVALMPACSSPDVQQAPPPGGASPVAARAPAYPTSEIAPDLPPLPGDLAEAARPAEVVRAAYEFAARHPEVLKYVPCFCGCSVAGHRDNEDCFVSSRDTAGHVTAWTLHGMDCEMCIAIAATARQMHNAGASVADIQQAIDRQYGGADRLRTPTPVPPHGGTP